MQLTKGAIGNLINRYKAVLKKCHLMNTFGSLAVAGMLIMGGAGVAVAAATAGISVNTNTQHDEDVNITGAYDIGVYASGAKADFSGKQLHIATTPGTGWGHGNVGLWANSTAPSGDRSEINFGQVGATESINIAVTDNAQNADISIGVWSRGDQNKAGGKINLNAETVTIKGHSNSGWIYGIYAQNATTTTEYDRATININAGKTYIDVTSGEPGRANAIVAMSQGVINIESDLYVNTQGGRGNAIVTRGDSIIAINSSGTHTVQMNGNVNFNYDGPTSGTKVDADVDITLSGADSYWNGNTLISWNDTPSDSSKLDVSEMTLTVKDGATWTPTAISNSDSQKYTALNKLTLDDGIVDVDEGVAITIENIGGKGAITNAGSVTIEKGSIEGPITFEKGDAKPGNMVTVGKDGITTLTGGVAGSGTIDKLAINKDGKTTITNAKLSGHDEEGRALWNNGTLTVNGGSFEGYKANVAGAIYNAAGAELTVDDVTFANNSSVNNVAGAINNRDGKVIITNSTFKGNDSGTKAGGAIANTAGSTEEGKLGTIIITGSTFEGNKAGNGGAVWNGSDGKVEIADSTFKGNTAVAEGGLGQGGAITNADEMTITGGSFANNTANYSGGAIYNDANAAGSQTSLTIDGTTFTGNSVTADFKTTNNDNIAGGAIFNDTGAKLDVKNATFTDNTSSLKGGAIFNRDGEVAITNSTFKNNSVPTSAGGAVLNESGDTSKTGTITITGSTFEGNKAGNGGAVWNGFNGKVDITASTFKSNTALVGIGQGGAITNADQMSITGSTFEGNQAGKIGGAIFNATSGKLDFNGTNTFTNNTAAGQANDIYNAGSITVADGTTTLNSGLTQVNGKVTVSTGATLDMASGSSLSFEGDNTALTIDGGTFVADFGQLLESYTDTNEANGITDENIIGTKGNLNLRLDGGSYTLDEYNAAKDTLLGQSGENASLNFLNATLDTEGKDLVVGADKDGTEVIITMTPVVVDANEAPSEAGPDAHIPSVPNQIVSVVAANDDGEEKELLKADTITVSGSKFIAKGLQIAGTENAEAVTLDVTGGSSLTLTGDEAGFTGVVNAEGDAVTTNVKVEGDAALTVGLEGNENAQNLVLNDVTVADGTFSVAGNGLDTTQVAANTLEVADASGTVIVDNASLTVENAVVENGLLSITDAVADLGTVKATGGVLFFDPSYGTIKSLANNELGSKLLVSDGSVVNVASGLDNLQELAQKAGFTTTADPATGGFILATGQSMLAVGQAIQLTPGGQIVVDAGVTYEETAPGSYVAKIDGNTIGDGAYFGQGSLLVVNGNTLNGATAAIDLSGATTKTLNVENGAKLLIADAVAGQTYTVITGETNTDTAFNGGAYADAETTGWKGDNLLTSSDMLTLTSTDGTVFMAKSEDAHTVFPGLSHELATAVNTLYGQKLNDVDADAMGVRFLSRATDNRFLGADKDAAASTIESAARIAFAGAVPQMTKMASDAGSNAVVNRLGFANPADGAQAMNAEGKIVDRNTTGFALWIAPLWQSQHGWGMEADNLDYGFNGNLGGVSLGADYTFENAIRAGITFNIGGGYAESSGGDLNSTENRMSFWGLGAYAGWNYENFGLMADVSYTSTWNDLQQDMDSRMGMGDLEADVQASAISAGLRAEYKLETSVLDVIPHIGVRYMSLNTWGFDAESNGGTVLEGDGFHQDIWTFPVGVTFTKDFTLDSGWSFKPSVDFSVIPAAGDIKAKQDVAFTGLPGSYEVETQMMDYLTWQGGVGLEMGNDTMSFGVNYTLQAGQHTTGHGVFGSFRYEF